MGDAYVWVSGAGERDLEVGLNVEASDEDAAAKALDAAHEAFAQDSATTMGPSLGDAEEGFSAANRTGAGFIDAELAGGELTLIYAANRAAAHLPGEDTLGSSPEFTDASEFLGSDFDPAAYLSFQPLIGFIESTGEPVEPAAKQVLGALGAAAVGWRTDGDRAVARAGVTVP